MEAQFSSYQSNMWGDAFATENCSALFSGNGQPATGAKGARCLLAHGLLASTCSRRASLQPDSHKHREKAPPFTGYGACADHIMLSGVTCATYACIAS